MTDLLQVARLSAHPIPDHAPPVDQRVPAVGLGEWPELDLGAADPLGLLAAVCAGEPVDLLERENFGAVAACEQVIRFIGARQIRHLATLTYQCAPHDEAGDSGVPDVITGVEGTAAEIAPILGLASVQAKARARFARDLQRDSRPLLDMVEAGHLDLYKATAMDTEMREVLQAGTWQWDTTLAVITATARREHTLRHLLNATHGGWAASFTTRREPAVPGTVAWTSRYRQTIHVPPVTLPGSNDWCPPDRPSGSQDATIRSGGNSDPALDSTDSAVVHSTDSTDDAESSASSNATQVERQALRERRCRSELDRISGITHHGSVSPTPRAPKPDPAEPPI